jgi:hypothetical protein
VQVTTDKDDIINNSDKILHDSVDLHIFEEAAFLNLNTVDGCKSNKMILTSGTQLRIKTNRDTLASKINYKVVYDDFSNQSASLSANENLLCSNKTIQLNDNGLLNVASSAGYCSIILNVQIDEYFKRTQSLIYLIKIRPITYLIADFQLDVSLNQDSIHLPNGELIYYSPIDLCSLTKIYKKLKIKG